MKRYTLAELERMTTLETGQFDNLKIDGRKTWVTTDGQGFFQGEMRVWLSRCTVDDGEPYDNKVTIEYYDGRCWDVIDTYQAV
jgi:hypothetical protein